MIGVLLALLGFVFYKMRVKNTKLTTETTPKESTEKQEIEERYGNNYYDGNYYECIEDKENNIYSNCESIPNYTNF